MTRSSLVLVNTGHGKGKTTAALGTLMRAVARGWDVCVIQFMKSEKWKVGEEKVALSLGVEWWTLGDGFTWESKDLDRTEAVARAAWVSARDKLAAGEHDLILLDEITYPLNFGWVDVGEVVDAVKGRPARTNVILTGRDAPGEIVEMADTVTEMRSIKHAFDRGIKARRGIDF